jgi:hypothetical protein
MMAPCAGLTVICRRQTQRFNLSNRCIPLVRKGLDVIILPGEGTTAVQQSS